MNEINIVGAGLAPAYVEEVRKCLLPFAKPYGEALERAMDYALTGEGADAVADLHEAMIRFDEAVDSPEFFGDVGPLWNLRYSLRKLTLLRATDDRSVAFAARFLHVASLLLAGANYQSRHESLLRLSESAWLALLTAADFEEYRVQAPIAPYLAFIALLGLPKDFVLVQALALDADDSWRSEYHSTAWTVFEDFGSYGKRYPVRWQQALDHVNQRVRTHAFAVAEAVHCPLLGLESSILECAIVTRRDLRSAAQDFIAKDSSRFENSVCDLATHKQASARAAAVDLIERFVSRERALPILESMRTDRSKKVQQRALAAVQALTLNEKSPDEEPTTIPRGESITGSGNVREWVPPAHVKEVRKCLAPLIDAHGDLIEPALHYALTGESAEAIERLSAGVSYRNCILKIHGKITYDSAWKDCFRHGFLAVRLFAATDDPSVAFAGRLLHAFAPIIAKFETPVRVSSNKGLSKEEQRAFAISELFAYRDDVQLAPYLAFVNLLGLPADFVLAEALALHANEDWDPSYHRGWSSFVGFGEYAKRYPDCWKQALVHYVPRVRAHAIHLAKALGEGLVGCEPAVVACATSSRRDLQAEARSFISQDPNRFEAAICAATEDSESPVRAESVDLVARFVPPDIAAPVLQALATDRSKKVQKRALTALRRGEELTEKDPPNEENLEKEISLDAPLAATVSAAIAGAHSHFVCRGGKLPSLEDTLEFVATGSGDPPRRYFIDCEERSLRALLSLPEITLVQYLRFLNFVGALKSNASEHEIRCYVPSWVLSAYARSRPSPPCLMSLVAAFKALDWDESLVAPILLANGISVEGWEISRFMDERQDDLIDILLNHKSLLFRDPSEREVAVPRLLSLCATLPTLPRGIVDAIWKTAVGSAVRFRRNAQLALEGKPGIDARVLDALSSKKQDTRSAVAGWTAASNLAAAIPVLYKALERETSVSAKEAMIAAVHQLGGSIDPWTTPEQLRTDAVQGLKKGIPKNIAWFPFKSLPEVRWENGELLDEDSYHWLLLQAHKLASPAPAIQLRRYCDKLTKESRWLLAEAVLQAWLNRDRIDERGGHGHGSSKRFAIAGKGLLALVAATGSSEEIDEARRYVDKHYGLRQAQCFALLRMVASMEAPESLLLLQRISRKFRTQSIKDEAGRLVDEYAKARGWSLQDLGDRSTPSGGLDESRQLRLTFGQSEFTAELDPVSLLLVIRSAEGKVRKSLPKPRVSDDDKLVADAKRQLGRSRKQVKSVVADRKAALHAAMSLQRSWSYPSWHQYLCAHPIVGILCQRLVWCCDQEGKVTTFVPVESNAFVDVHGAPFTPDVGSTIRLAHESNTSDQAARLWVEHFEQNEIDPLFPQFHRSEAIRRVFPTYRDGLPDVKGLEVEALEFFRRILSAGFAKGPVEDGPRICEFFFRLPGSDLVGVLTCSGIDPGLGTLGTEIVEMLSGDVPGVELEALELCRGEEWDKPRVDPKTEAPQPFALEIGAAVAKAVGEQLRVVRSAS